jgi:hypothetical protein
MLTKNVKGASPQSTTLAQSSSTLSPASASTIYSPKVLSDEYSRSVNTLHKAIGIVAPSYATSRNEFVTSHITRSEPFPTEKLRQKLLYEGIFSQHTCVNAVACSGVDSS